MNEAPETEQEPTGYIRLPWQLVGGAMFLFLVLLFGFGLFANRNLRPQTTVLPTSTPLAEATSTPLPVAAPAAVQASTQTAATPVTATETATATPIKLPLTAPPTEPVLAAETATPSALPTIQPELADEVAKSYMKFWRVTSQALLELDNSHLTEVMDGDYLATVANRIEELRKEGRAIKTVVVLNYSVISATQDSATIVDDLEDNSFYVKIGTEDPLTNPASDQFRVLYKLHNFSGTWKVVDSVRS